MPGAARMVTTRQIIFGLDNFETDNPCNTNLRFVLQGLSIDKNLDTILSASSFR